ncbi:MAG: dihydroneopterin triphosphate diphosphatase, partial [Gammaproteobacteria bacterium]|nr:dihydroneopterin triphosphate diphosphatase [Gammaproteobacteria bacterium]
MVADSAVGNRYKRPESVLVVVYNTEDKVLLLKRADHDEFWQSVTGSLRWPYETSRCAAVRELLEETGLQGEAGLRTWDKTFCFPILPKWRARYAPGITVNREHAFSLKVDGESTITLNHQEHSEYQWLTFDAAAAKVWS